MDKEIFFSKISEKVFLTAQIRTLIEKNLSTLYFEKYDHLLSPGHIPTEMFYIEEGLVMGHTVRQKQKVVQWFQHNGSFLIPSCFFHQQPATEYITFREPTVLFSLPHTIIQSINKIHHESLNLFLLLAEDSIQAGKEREYMMRMFPEDRYRHLAKTQPYLFAGGHFEFLASYMNMSRRHFVRIRNRFAKEKN
ncbi:Crp/Fnr family transcriptional regulator [Mucilaginibacter lappiensis]|uniref:Signal-transduction protein with cAMP-binding, CBS, and nucleotidyltransferase domain n=1 Tax=Mucilaginibacter lappiensis TaxID=354630 RepID=A0A841JKL4_9SPHI|nr:Crp/Fnr family transcriptional regulator [Mucilaginibacter lappiensis]MBB6131719.1 signal-transduction protein with cAMP-binding, CBS, and nucleotidyltransferase domain [Mucilaginibacter lappiensis]